MGFIGKLMRRVGLKRKVFERRVGNIVFLSRHPLHQQIAEDIVAGLAPGFSPSRRFIVYCGAHHRFRWHVLRPGIKIGLQTEQFFDDEGQQLWGYNKSTLERTFALLKHVHVMLDLNETNKPAYAQVVGKDREKLLFGPYIFPDVPPPATPYEDERSIFFGAMGVGRRETIVPRLEAAGICDVVKTTTFGEALFQRVRRYRAVLNIHYMEGIYTEYPRLLSALLQGKPVVSEPLASNLTEGVHYVGLQSVESADYVAVYDAFAKHVCERYSFQKFVERLDGQGMRKD